MTRRAQATEAAAATLAALLCCGCAGDDDEGGRAGQGAAKSSYAGCSAVVPSCDGGDEGGGDAATPPDGGPPAGDAAASSSAAADGGGGASGQGCVPICIDAGPDEGPICARDRMCEERVELALGQHVDGDIDYGDEPPAGGPHNPCWGDYGVHDVPLPPERFVHNLEHGAVVFLYRCPDGCESQVAELETFVGSRSWGILTAYERSMSTRYAALAFGHRLLTDVLDLDAFAAFYEAHADRAPESVASGAPASCR